VRIALALEYDGAAFCGWQTQPAGCAVQDALEGALAQVAGHPVDTVCAGRTDAGVHALVQVVHFDVTAERPLTAWVRGANALLPGAASVLWAHPVDDGFHARYGATERHYRYVLLNRTARPGLEHGRVGWCHRPLDVGHMRAAAQRLLGEHDFSAFRSSECQARSPVRELRRLDIERTGDYVVFDVAANAFLHHMVRNLVGLLVHVGSGRQPPDWAGEVLASRDRRLAAPTFDGAGLYLVAIRYDTRWGLPPTDRRGEFRVFSGER